MAIGPSALAARIGHHGGVPTRAMEVQIRVEVGHVELLQSFGMLAGNRAITDLLADHSSVLSLHQSIVGGSVGPRLGELDQQLFQQLSQDAIDKLRTVVAVEAE